jgi:hypothetical protein
LPSFLQKSATLFAPNGIALSLAIIFAFVLIASAKSSRAEKFLRKIEAACSAFSQQETLAILAVFLSVVAIRLSALPLLPIPIPGIHDEFSYLLIGDTFAHGRLTNPSHPMWRSFDTFHENWLPTYSSMYPPAQGVVLAIGQILGNPWIGVLLSDAAMCAAIVWMLVGWMPKRWALLGAFLAVLKLGISSYWMNSYWGGAVAAIGGALVLGALPRIRKHTRVRDTLFLALGVAILANSRPYEGLLLSIPVAIWLVAWLAGRMRNSNTPPIVRLRRVLVPLALCLALTAGAMAYYNVRLTGHAFLFPYTLNVKTHVTGPIFLWQHAKPPLHYNNQQFEDFYNGWEREEYDHTWPSALAVFRVKWFRLKSVFFWPADLLLLPGFLFAFRDKRIRPLLYALFICAAGIFAAVWSNPHYAAPITCVIFALLVQSIRHLRASKRFGRPVGAAISRAVVVLLAIQTFENVRAHICDPLAWTCTGDPSRVAILQRLARTPGKHLVIVRYGDDHNIHDEWVFNGADIDAANILWARELDAEQNAKLIRYFSDRTIWLVEPDSDNEDLEPYALATSPSP